MLGFSHAPELIILLIIAFMVFGPEKLPEIARGAGRGLREFRRMSSELQSSLGSTLQEPIEQMQQVHQEMQQHVQDVTRIASEPFQQQWVPVTPYVSPAGAAELEPATINEAAAHAQGDDQHVSPVADVPASRPPAPRRPSIALSAATLAPGPGSRLTVEPTPPRQEQASDASESSQAGT